MKKLSTLAVALAALACAGAAQSAVTTAAIGDFGANPWAVGFNVAAANPVFQPSSYGGLAGDPQVSIRGWFDGQSPTIDPNVCGTAQQCVDGTPTPQLALDTQSQASIGRDPSRPGPDTNLSVLGNPVFFGPVAIHFSQDVLAVGFDVGVLNRRGAVRITAYDRDGQNVYSVVSTNCVQDPFDQAGACTGNQGIEFFGMADFGGPNRAPVGIAGVLIQLNSFEPNGFSVDNLIFRTTAVTPPTGVPEPGALALVGLALAALGLMRRRKV